MVILQTFGHVLYLNLAHISLIGPTKPCQQNYEHSHFMSQNILFVKFEKYGPFNDILNEKMLWTQLYQ